MWSPSNRVSDEDDLTEVGYTIHSVESEGFTVHEIVPSVLSRNRWGATQCRFALIVFMFMVNVRVRVMVMVMVMVIVRARY